MDAWCACYFCKVVKLFNMVCQGSNIVLQGLNLGLSSLKPGLAELEPLVRPWSILGSSLVRPWVVSLVCPCLRPLFVLCLSLVSPWLWPWCCCCCLGWVIGSSLVCPGFCRRFIFGVLNLVLGSSQVLNIVCNSKSNYKQQTEAS